MHGPMRLRRFVTIGLFGPTLLAQTGILGPAPLAQANGSPPEVEIRVAPLVAQYGWLRKQANLGPAKATDPKLRNVLAELALADRELRSEEGWNLVAAPLVRCGNSMDFTFAAEHMPEEGTVFRIPLPLRANAMRLAGALNQTEPYFLESVWPSLEASLVAERDRLLKTHGKALSSCIQALRKDLALEASTSAVPIFLAAEGPGSVATSILAAPRHAFAIVTTGGGTLSPGGLAEAVLCGYAHAIDLASQSRTSAPLALAAELGALGVPPEGTIAREALFLLRATAAASVVGRLLDKRHTANGEKLGFYASAEAISAQVQKAWPDVVAGKRPREEAVAELAATIAEKTVARPSPKPTPRPGR